MLFELLYKAVSLAVLTPLIYGLINLALYASGVSYLSSANIGGFLRAPVTLLVLLLILLVVAFHSAFDMTAVIYGIDCSHRGIQTNVYDLARTGFRRTLRLLRCDHLPLIVYVLIILPLVSYGVTQSIGAVFSLPDFLNWYINKRTWLRVLYQIVRIALTLLAVFWMFSIHFASLEGVRFREGIRRSIRLVRRRFFQILALLLGWNLLWALGYALVGVIGIWGARYLCGLLLKVELLYAVVLSFSVTFLIVLTILLSCCSVPAAFALISHLYYRCRALDGEPAASQPSEISRLSPTVSRRCERVMATVLAVSLVVCCVYVNAVRTGRIGLSSAVTVTAHRGSSSQYPENTMYAFAGAVENGADCIELDVQQTKDGVLVVMHDASLRRTTGVKQNIWEVTYDEIRDLDCGSWFNRSYADARIPTLDEVLAFAKEAGVRLNIELKPTGHETAFEQSVADLIAAYDFADSCIVTSMSYESLEAVKAADPELTTAYVMSVAYGRITDLTCADEFSVQASFVTRPLVRRIHNEGKRIHVWTVNTEASIQKMLDLDVDGIITDNVILARELVAESRSSDLITDYVRRITGKSSEE